MEVFETFLAGVDNLNVVINGGSFKMVLIISTHWTVN